MSGSSLEPDDLAAAGLAPRRRGRGRWWLTFGLGAAFALALVALALFGALKEVIGLLGALFGGFVDAVWGH